MSPPPPPSSFSSLPLSFSLSLSEMVDFGVTLEQSNRIQVTELSLRDLTGIVSTPNTSCFHWCLQSTESVKLAIVMILKQSGIIQLTVNFPSYITANFAKPQDLASRFCTKAIALDSVRRACQFKINFQVTIRASRVDCATSGFNQCR
nr:hypothetical transcript [Hymenolepis microstoma]